MGLLTKIFGNPEGGANASGEPSAAEQSSGATAGAEDPVISAYPKGDSSNSGIRPVVEAPPQRSREPVRASVGNRRPEHPRMYLRPTPATVDPAVPGSSRRPQISVRPAARERDTHRAAPPSPPKRSGSERSRGEPARERPSEPSAAPGTLPPASRPKNAMVVSPVSLTPEEVQLPPGTRPKMRTLVGLGAALETPPLPLVAPIGGGWRAAASRSAASNGSGNHTPSRHTASKPAASKHVAATPADASQAGAASGSDNVSPAGSLASAASGSPEPPSPTPERTPPRERAPFDALSEPSDSETPEDITAPVQLLADFALKLSLGPVSQSWVPAVRRCAEALLVTAMHRHETALAALSARLLALVPNPGPTEADRPLDEARSLDAISLEESAGPPLTIEGDQREQILHEVTRLAGVLPEWPAAAQDLAEEARRRETRIVREILTVVDGFKRDQRARLEERMQLEELAAMAPSAIAEEFEAPLERASELSLVLDNYRRERQTRAPDVGNAIALGRALGDLARRCHEFDDCDPEQKDSLRGLRLERRRALTSVNLLLAERGELEWLEQLEPLSIGERVERLTQWFQAARLEIGRTEAGPLESGSERNG